MFDKKIGFIGPGKMAKSIVNGIIATSFTNPENLYIYGRTAEKVAHFAELGCFPCLDLQKMCADCSIIFLCIKPQNFPEIINNLKPLVSDKILYVSIAAGITSEKIFEMLGQKVNLIRAMPNTPLLIGKGATAISAVPGVTTEDISTICDIFSSCGAVCEIEEKLMDPIINVNGSTPAYIYLFAKYICDFAEKQGIDREEARILFARTLIGSASMLLESDLSEEALIGMVASKGGTTQAALDVLENGFQEILDAAMTACLNRAKELGR